jgi:3-(3-hydroxy-phenyl)propionate hydroxylase
MSIAAWRTYVQFSESSAGCATICGSTARFHEVGSSRFVTVTPCPTPLGHHRWEFPVLDGEDEKELVTDAAVWRLLNNQGITDNEVKILRAVVYSHHVRFADRWRVGRIFLAGDAAHVMPPWIGQGMAAGVRDAANLCWKIAAVVCGELPESVLDSYAVERQPHVRQVTSKAVFFGRVITERRKLVTVLRDPAFRIAMRLPFVGNYLRDAKWFPGAHYPEGIHRAV